MDDHQRSTLTEDTPLLHSDGAIDRAEEESRLPFSTIHAKTTHSERLKKVRGRLKAKLVSKWGHYCVLALVAIDISSIFATFLISLHICEHANEKRFDLETWLRAADALDVASLVFSCLFMVELCLSIFSFGTEYFRSRFRIFDGAVILAAFIFDILLHGPIEEAGSLVVVGRLWRVFKIIEELSSGANDEINELQEKVTALERQCAGMRLEIESGRDDARRSSN